jgi:hypothetical protein
MLKLGIIVGIEFRKKLEVHDFEIGITGDTKM